MLTLARSCLGMDTSKNEWVHYGTNEMERYINSTVNGNLLHLHINLNKNSPVKDPGKSLTNNHFTIVNIANNTFN